MEGKSTKSIMHTFILLVPEKSGLSIRIELTLTAYRGRNSTEFSAFPGCPVNMFDAYFLAHYLTLFTFNKDNLFR